MAALAAGAPRRRRGRLGQPVLGAGPRPRRRHRQDHDRLPQRQACGRSCTRTSASSTSATASRATCWRPSAACPGERYVISGATLTSREALEIVVGHDRRARAAALPAARRRAPAAAALAEGGFQRRAQAPAGLPRDGPHDAARPPLRRLARRRASSGCATRRSATRSPARSSGRSRRACVKRPLPAWPPSDESRHDGAGSLMSMERNPEHDPLEHEGPATPEQTGLGLRRGPRPQAGHAGGGARARLRARRPRGPGERSRGARALQRGRRGAARHAREDRREALQRGPRGESHERVKPGRRRRQFQSSSARSSQ